MTLKTTPPLVAAMLCLSLAACDGGPSASEMQAAFARNVAAMSGPETAVANLQLGGKAPGHVDDRVEVSNLRKTACKPVEGGDGYDCEFAMTVNGIVRPGMKARFRKGADGRLAVAG